MGRKPTTGITRKVSGHLMFTSPKERRGKYVHREVVRELLEETPYSVRLLIQVPYEVHHMDYDKENNHPSNLLLLSTVFHSTLTADGRMRRYGKFEAKFQPTWSGGSMGMFEDKESEAPF